MEDKQGVFGVHCLGAALRRVTFKAFVPPNISALDHGNRKIGPAMDDDMLNGGAVLTRLCRQSL